MGRRDRLQPEAPDDLALAPAPRLAEFAAALALATDLSYGQPFGWVLRSCLIALNLAQTAGLDAATRREAYYVTLLGYAGCSATSHAISAITGDEIALRGALASIDLGRPDAVLAVLNRQVGQGRPPATREKLLARAVRAVGEQSGEIVSGQCDVAQRTAERLGLEPRIQQLLRQVYERWDGSGAPEGLRGDAIEIPARIAQFALDVGLIVGSGTDHAVEMAQSRAGGAFDPALVHCFTANAAAILAGAEVESGWDAVLEAEPGGREVVAPQCFTAALESLADVSDLKSRFTVGRSRRVAEVVSAAAPHLRMSSGERARVFEAALIQDMGRLGVPDTVWEKRGRLTDAEWEQVRLHPYLTERIFARSAVLAPLGSLGSLHHERVDGSGYHRGARGDALGIDARLLAVADVWQALREERPHRPALSEADAAGVLTAEARAGRLDPDAVNAVLSAGQASSVPPARERIGGLTEREVEVLRLVARGLTNRQIGQRLSISAKTVGHHVQHIYDRIGVSSRAGATLWAAQQRIV